MDTSQINPWVKVAIAAGVIYAGWKWGSPEVKGMALGAAGVFLVNQIPVVRDGANARLLAA